MKGIDLSRAYFERFGRGMLDSVFPAWRSLLAVGLAGSGSECLGFDDDLSKDHDYDPGFLVFLPGEELVSREDAFRLERAYAALPKEFEGIRRSAVNPGGGARRGIVRIADFLSERIGVKDASLTGREWLFVPETTLNEVVNGELFFDGLGLFSTIRKQLSFYPDEITRQKLAGYLLSAGQSGQYNYTRCVSRGEKEAAQYALCVFVYAVQHIIFLLNGKYMPYYKWSFRAMKDLPLFADLSDALGYLLLSDNEKETSRLKETVISDVASLLIEELKKRGLSTYSGKDLDGHAYSVKETIRNAELRTMNIMSGVESL